MSRRSMRISSKNSNTHKECRGQRTMTIDLTGESPARARPLTRFQRNLTISLDDTMEVEEMKTKLNKSCQTDKENSPPLRSSKPRSALGDCPICLDELGEKELVSTLCGHVFCIDCLVVAITLDPHCPTCRANVSGDKPFHPLYIGTSK